MLEIRIIAEAEKYVQELFAHDYSGHDVWHTMRVTRNAAQIAAAEKADLFIVQLAALLHDVDDIKLSPETHKNLDRAVTFMQKHRLPEDTIRQVCTIIREISFGGNPRTPATLEGQCVQDADRLDATGAIGIGRAFAYGGSHNRVMHDPDILPREEITPEEYRNHQSTTINHFYEKLFKLKNLMNTETARRLAEGREIFMRTFLEKFMKEWEGEG